MFKKSSKLAIVGVMGLSMALTGCNSSKQASASEDPKELLKAASQKFSEAENYEMGINMVMSIDAKEQGKLEMNMDADAKVIEKPSMAFQMDTNMDMKMGDQSQNVKMQQFIVEEDSQYVMYAETMGAWSKTPVGDAEAVKKLMKDPTANVETYINSIDDISISGEKTIEGVDCKEIKINLTKDYFDTVFADLQGMDSLGLDQATLEKTMDSISGIDSLPVYYYIGKESGDLVGCNMDMSELMKQAFIAEGIAQEGEIGDVSVKMDMTFTNVGGVSEITVPEEAKSAQ